MRTYQNKGELLHINSEAKPVGGTNIYMSHFEFETGPNSGGWNSFFVMSDDQSLHVLDLSYHLSQSQVIGYNQILPLPLHIS